MSRPFTLMFGDCLDRMSEIAQGSVNMVAADLPYKATIHAWDSIIPCEPLWKQYKRVTTRNAAIVLTAIQPFASLLVMSNLKMFRYELIAEKTMPTMFQQAKKMPLRKHENVLVFYRKLPTYNPQFEAGKPYKRAAGSGDRKASGFHSQAIVKTAIDNKGTRYPGSVKKFSNSNHGLLHPTQKSIELMEYLIKTYSNEGDTILDNAMGSGTTGEACINLNRKFIGIEKDPHYFEVAQERIEKAWARREMGITPLPNMPLFPAPSQARFIEEG